MSIRDVLATLHATTFELFPAPTGLRFNVFDFVFKPFDVLCDNPGYEHGGHEKDPRKNHDRL